MSRFYVPRDSIKGNNILLVGEEAHHIVDVMRLGKLDHVVVFDGTGNEYVGFISQIEKRSVSIKIIQTRRPEKTGKVRSTLIQAIPKKDKMDYIVEKSTELGVHSIIPVVTDRTIVKWDDKKRESSAQRWRKIAREASKQCGRPDVPVIDDIKKIGSVLAGSNPYDIKMMAALTDETVSIKKTIAGFKGERIAFAIGPEGDFTPEEIKKASGAGFKLISLGPRVLKSDTAGLAVLSILGYEFDDK